MKQLLITVLIPKAFRFTLPKPNLLGPKPGKFSKLRKFRWISVYRFLITLVLVSNGANMFIRCLKIIVDLLIQYSATQLDLLVPGNICKSGADMGGSFRVILFGGPDTVLHNYLVIVSPKTCFKSFKTGFVYVNVHILPYSSYGS